jgi:hypothetical protein
MSWFRSSAQPDPQIASQLEQQIEMMDAFFVLFHI